MNILKLDDASSSVFINKDVYDYPPADGNNVFYMDGFLLRNIETNTRMSSGDDISVETIPNDLADVIFTDKGRLNMQILESASKYDKNSQYTRFKYGDKVVFNIPATTLIMRKKI